MRNQTQSHKGRKRAKRALAVAAASILALSPVMEMEVAAADVEAVQTSVSTVVVQGAGGGGAGSSVGTGGQGHAGYVQIGENVVVGDGGSGKDGGQYAGSGGKLEINPFPITTGSSISEAIAGDGGTQFNGIYGGLSSYITSGALILSGNLSICGGNGGSAGENGNGSAGGDAKLNLGTLVCDANSTLSFIKGSAGNGYGNNSGGTGGIAIATIGALQVKDSNAVTLGIDEGCSLSLDTLEWTGDTTSAHGNPGTLNITSSGALSIGTLNWAGGNTSGQTILTYNTAPNGTVSEAGSGEEAGAGGGSDPTPVTSTVTVSCSNADVTWKAMNGETEKASITTTPGSVVSQLDLTDSTSVKITAVNARYDISGTIDAGTTDANVSGLTVNLYNADDTTFANSLDSAITDGEGKYTIHTSNLTNGDYVVRIAGVSGSYDASTATVNLDNADVTGADITLTKTVVNPSGGHSSSGSSTTTTTTKKNDDGSTTTTVTNKTTGKVTETTKKPDGTTIIKETDKDGNVKETVKDADGKTTVTETKKDGTVTVTETDKDGNSTETKKNPDGSTEITDKKADGNTIVTKTDTDGKTTVDVTVKPGTSGSGTDIKIPAKYGDEDGTVTAEITYNDGKKETVSGSYSGSNGKISLTVAGSASIEILDDFVPLSAASLLPFTDVNADRWSYDNIAYVYNNELFKGVSDTEFGPEVSMNRCMLVTVLYRMAGSPDIENEIWGYPYADVDAESYYAAAVYWARMNGIVNGYSDEVFGVNDDITREQLATILYRYATYKGYTTDAAGMANANANEETNSNASITAGGNTVNATGLTAFDDVSAISSYAIDAMNWAVNAGIINGSDNKLMPKGSATREQVAAMVQRFCEKVVK